MARDFHIRAIGWYVRVVRPRPAFTRLLVVLLLLQWGTAFGHCLRLAASDQPLHVQICTPEGLRSVTLVLEDHAPGHDGEPSPQHAAAMICPVCGALGAAALPPPTIVPQPSQRMVLVAPREAPTTPSLALSPRPLPPSRAPPAA